MRMGLVLTVLLLAGSTASAGEIIAGVEVPEGLEAREWARSPQFFNPTNIDIDARGRIWVAEGVNYRETWKKQNALKHPDGDRIMILEDTDGDGTCDSSKVFVQDKDLLCPLGIAVLGNKVLVSCSPNLFVFTDTDGDDKADKREVFLTGFGGKDHDHGLHSAVGFLDGRLYFNVGNDGPHEVKDAGGWWLHSGSCYVYGPTGNTGNRKSDDGRVWTGGIALRVDADGKKLTPLAHNFRNSYEVAIDSFGNLWQSDNDDDGNQGCRASFVMEGANMGYFSADGTRTWGADRRPGQSTLAAHWHQDDPGVQPIGDNTGAGGPTGVVVYEGGLLPEKFVGSMFDCDAGRNCVWVHKPVADGAGFKLERSELIKLSAGATTAPADQKLNWFRPSDVAVGTDGAIYVSDWYDPGVGGHDMRDKVGGGRIIRIAPKGDKTRPPTVDLTSLDGQITALNNPAVNIRYQAANALASGGEVAFERLIESGKGGGPVERARAIWVLPRLGQAGVAVVSGPITTQADPNERLVAFRALRAVGAHRSKIVSLIGDESPALRREAAIALRGETAEGADEFLILLAERYPVGDRLYLEAVGIGCEGREERVFRGVLNRSDQRDPLKWSQATADLAWRLHPPGAIDALAARAASASLSPDARRRAIDAIAFINDPRAADVMVKLTSNELSDVRELATWWAMNRSGNDWKSYAAVAPFAEEAVRKAHAVAAEKRANDRQTLEDETKPLADRRKAAGRLSGSAEGAVILVSIAMDGKFPENLKEFVSDQLTRNPDPGIRALASQYFPRQGKGAPLPPIKEIVAMKGDAARGNSVFTSATAACSRCHRFGDEGKDVGPDLSAIRTKYARPELIDAILNPSANIAFGYEPWIVKVKSGDVFCGFIIGDGESVTIKESSGEQRSFPASEVVLRKKQTMSIMPDNIALGMTAQDLADLAEFLLAAPVAK